MNEEQEHKRRQLVKSLTNYNLNIKIISFGMDCKFEGLKQNGYLDVYEKSIFYDFLNFTFANLYAGTFKNIRAIVKNIESVKARNFWGDASLYFTALHEGFFEDETYFDFFVSFGSGSQKSVIECHFNEDDDENNYLNIVSESIPFKEDSTDLLNQIESLNHFNYILSYIIDGFSEESEEDE